jgi:hypothetical protein
MTISDLFFSSKTGSQSTVASLPSAPTATEAVLHHRTLKGCLLTVTVTEMKCLAIPAYLNTP